MDLSGIGSRIDILERLASDEITTGEAIEELNKLGQQFLISDEEHYWQQMQEISSLTLRTIRLEKVVLNQMKEIKIGQQSYSQIVITDDKDEVIAVISAQEIIEKEGYRVKLM